MPDTNDIEPRKRFRQRHAPRQSSRRWHAVDDSKIAPGCSDYFPKKSKVRIGIVRYIKYRAVKNLVLMIYMCFPGGDGSGAMTFLFNSRPDFFCALYSIRQPHIRQPYTQYGYTATLYHPITQPDRFCHQFQPSRCSSGKPAI